MGARKYDLVKPNYEAIKTDLKKYGLTVEQLAASMGKNGSYISQMFRRDRADRSTIEAVEDRMFREHGSYYDEFEEEAEAPAEPPKPQMTEGVGIVLKQILSVVGAISSYTAKNEANTDKVLFRIDGFKANHDKKMEEVIKAVKESNAANEIILQDILQKQKEMTTLAARILSAMERRQS